VILDLADRRSNEPEILDGSGVPEDVRALCYDELTSAHRRLGNIRAVVQRISQDTHPVRTVLDIGCAFGSVLFEICQELEIEGLGIDVCPPAVSRVPILQLDAVREKLPSADVAIAMLMTHHLSEADCVQLIRNVSRSCRRFIILDLVRHPLPAFMFRSFVAPFVHRITAFDGKRSFERAFTVEEMKDIVERSLGGTAAKVQYQVGPLYIRQIVDIAFTG
jgi:SAM-dependent methyltransferase